MADDPAPAPEAAAPAAAPEEPPPMPQGPPRDEPGFPALGMLGGQVNELLNAVTPQQMLMFGVGIKEGVSVNGMGMLAAEQSQAVLTGNYQTRHGALGATLVQPCGQPTMLQTTLEGFQPLPFMQLNSQLMFVNGVGLGMGMVNVILPPFILSANLMGQMSAELVLGGQVSERDTVILGAHAWGLPGAYGGVKCGGEWTRAELDADGELLSQSTVTLAVTRPPLTAEGHAAPWSATLSAMHNLSAREAVGVVFDRKGRLDQDGAPAPSSIAMSILAQGQLGAGKRVKGRLSTRGVVGLALELSGDASSLALQCELDATGAKAPPKFGATLQLSP